MRETREKVTRRPKEAITKVTVRPGDKNRFSFLISFYICTLFASSSFSIHFVFVANYRIFERHFRKYVSFKWRWQFGLRSANQYNWWNWKLGVKSKWGTSLISSLALKRFSIILNRIQSLDFVYVCQWISCHDANQTTQLLRINESDVLFKWFPVCLTVAPSGRGDKRNEK